MRKISYNFLFIIGLMLTLGMTSAFGVVDDKNKRPKNTGILTVKTAPVAYPIKVDGTYIGMSGTNSATEFSSRRAFTSSKSNFRAAKSIQKKLKSSATAKTACV
jgi:hypothetical protein